MSGSSLRLSRAFGALLAAGAFVGLSACRDDSGGDTGAFCVEVEEHLEELRATPQTLEDVDALIGLWKDVGDDAPLSIEPHWQAHILAFETALEGQDMEEVYARVYATERSSVAVAAWVQERCGFSWGPVATIVPQPSTTSTEPGATAPTGASPATTTPATTPDTTPAATAPSVTATTAPAATDGT